MRGGVLYFTRPPRTHLVHLNDDPVCRVLQISSVSCAFAVRLISFSSLPGWDVCCDLLDDIVAFERVVGADARVDLELSGGRRRRGKVRWKFEPPGIATA